MAIDWDAYRKKAKQMDQEDAKARKADYEQRNAAKQKNVSSPTKKTTTAKTVSSPLKTTTVTGKKGLRDERDIAPVMKTFEPKKTAVTAPVRKETAVARAILSTAGDLGMNFASGAVAHIEGITDAVGYGAADVAEKFGKGSLADRIREQTKKSYTQKLFGDAIKTYGEHSISGDFTDSLAQGFGQVGVSTLSGALLGGLGLGTKAVSAITRTGTAMSGFGSGAGQAYEGGATDEEAKKYGMIAGASEALTEILFGGLGKVSKALGHSKGLLKLDDMLARKVSNIFSNQIMKNIAEFGIKSSAEGFEEVLSGIAQAVGKKITYMKDEDFSKILKDENLLEQFLVGMTTSAFMQSGDLVKSIADKTDFITGLDQKEQAVVDKAVESRIAEAEKDGKKLSKKDKDKIYNETVKALDEGDIDTDIIESVLGGEKYEGYKKLKDKSDAFRDKVTKANEQLQQKYDELQKEHDSLDSNNLEQSSRQSAIKEEQTKLKEEFERNKSLLKELDEDKSLDVLKDRLGKNVSESVKDSRLSESYKEKARRKEAFKADLSKYDEKQQAVIKKAVESGILNNTRKTHSFVDFIAKISANKGVSFDFTSNEKLKESGFAIEGRTVNGLVTKDGIQINVNSAKALNTVVGHEVMHIFEGTELYTEIQKLVKEAAVKKGEYQSRYDEITELYEGIKDADVNAELTADLVGDYLFSDEDFIRRLSTENRSIFTKIRDEINYLCRIATAGSAEARKLEQAKKLFEKVYREAEAKTTEGTKYSMAGTKSKTHNFTALEQASRLEDVGKATSEEIRQQTGWYRGYDGRWRYEIDDSKMKIRDVDITSGETKLSEVIEHPELFEAYPQLKDITVSAFPSIFDFGTNGKYNPARKEISLNSDFLVNTKVEKEIAQIRESAEYISYKNRLEEVAKAHGKKRLELSKEFKAIRESEDYKEYIDSFFECENKEQEKTVTEKWESTEDGKRYEEIKAELAKMDKENPQIIIENEFRESETGKRYHELLNNIDTAEVTDNTRTRSTLIHEIQHAIQDIEGFAGGSSPEFWKKAPAEKKPGTIGYAKSQRDEIGSKILSTASPEFVEAFRAYNRGDIEYSDIENGPYSEEELELLWDYDEADREVSYLMSHGERSDESLYFSTAGEIEARDASQRMDYTAEQRKSTRPDIDRTDVVFAEGENSSFASKDIEKIHEILYNDKNNPLSVSYRATTVHDSSLKWVYDAKIFSYRESMLFHDAISQINTGSHSFDENINSIGEYMIPIDNKIVFTNGDFYNPYVREIVEVLTDSQTRFEDIREAIFNVEKGRSSKQDAARYVQNTFGKGRIVSYKSGNNGVYGWEDGKRKGKTRSAVIRNHLYKQYGARNDRTSRKAQINEISPIKETSSEDGVFSLSSLDTTPKKYGDYAVYGEDVMLEGKAKPKGKAEIIAPTAKKEITAPMRADVNKKFPMVDEEAAPALTDKQIADMQRERREAAESLTDADMPPQAEAPIYSADTIPLNKNTLKNVSDVGRKILMLNAKEKRSLTELIQKYSTSEDMDSEALFGEIKKLFGEKSFTERIEEVANVRQALSGYRIGVSSYIKNGISDYAEFRKRNFGKLLIANDGIPVDTAYMELSEAYPDFFPSDIVNPTDQLLQMAEVANMERDITSTYEVDDDVIREATETIGDMVVSYQEKQLIKVTEREGKAILREEAEPTRSKLHKSIVDGIKAKFTEKGFDFDEVLKKAKNIGALKLNDNTPQRAMEKTLGPKAGRILADATVNKVAQNETEGIKWLNSYLDRKNGILAQISKQYGIKPGSKESAAAQMYAEGFYVDERTKDKPIYAYGDAELAKDFPDPNVQERIKGLAKDERIRKIYDETLEKINESRKRNLFPEIPRRDDYFLHFRAMGDTFSTLGLPFNPNDIRAKDLPTDLNGVTADLKPGQPYFASANKRRGKRTSFDLLGGLEQYLTSAKNQIYHIDDIQNLRAVRNYIADSFGQNILDNLDTLSDEEVDTRIEQMYDSHLSNFARFLNEEANVLAGKTALIDRGLEGFVGRRGMTFLKTLNGQVGANMVGGNISSALTNFLAVAQALAKTKKADFTKAFVQMSTNNIKSIFGKETDGFTENSPVVIRRKGAEQFYRKPYQKIGDMGYLLMSAVDNVSTELIARTKFNEFTKKGMDEQTAHFETDKWVSRLMGDRSLGQQPLLYNSKTLGILTKFQLEVRNQLDSQFYDTIQEAKLSNEEIENKLLRNAKTAAQVTSTFVQLAVLQHIFGQAFERMAGYNPAFDIIEVLAKMFGYGDDEEDEDTVLDNLGEGFLALLEDLPYTSTFTGGRIPISSALPSWENIEQIVKGEDESGNKKSRLETAVKVFDEVAPYYILPGGAGQIKKSAKGLKMFDDDLPIAGSYTESGKLRFPVEETPWNVAQAAVFGQYANENAREYFDEGYAPLNEKQIQELVDSDLPIADYWEYRKGLSALKPEKGKKQVTLNQKGDYIGNLDLPMKAKNVLINSIADRETPIDMKTYSKYKDFEEFDFATKNPDIYKVLQQEGITVEEYKKKYEKSVFMRTDDFAWAAQNPEQYTFSKAVTDNVTEYKRYTSELYKIRADKDRYGRSISGSTKKKKKAYIWNLDLEWGAKYVLFKKEYPSDDTYNREIIDYVNKSGLTYDEKVTVFEELGFKVKK